MKKYICAYSQSKLCEHNCQLTSDADFNNRMTDCYKAQGYTLGPQWVEVKEVKQ